MTENPNLPAPSSPGSKLRPVILYGVLPGVLPGVLMLGFGWYYGRPPALLLVCWAFLGVGLGAFLYWKARPQWIALIGLLTVMMCKPFMHHYFLGAVSSSKPNGDDMRVSAGEGRGDETILTFENLRTPHE